jgi:hypothetical protein
MFGLCSSNIYIVYIYIVCTIQKLIKAEIQTDITRARESHPTAQGNKYQIWSNYMYPRS